MTAMTAVDGDSDGGSHVVLGDVGRRAEGWSTGQPSATLCVDGNCAVVLRGKAGTRKGPVCRRLGKLRPELDIDLNPLSPSPETRTVTG